MRNLRVLFTILLSVLFPFAAGAQNAQYVRYVQQYKDLAIEQMKKYNIPASITLAQALLESGAGQSTLARESNNHFGIKCFGMSIITDLGGMENPVKVTHEEVQKAAQAVQPLMATIMEEMVQLSTFNS